VGFSRSQGLHRALKVTQCPPVGSIPFEAANFAAPTGKADTVSYAGSKPSASVINRTYDFVGTDTAPTLGRLPTPTPPQTASRPPKPKRNRAGTALTTNALVVPVVQTSIAIVANLPAGARSRARSRRRNFKKCSTPRPRNGPNWKKPAAVALRRSPESYGKTSPAPPTSSSTSWPRKTRPNSLAPRNCPKGTRSGRRSKNSIRARLRIQTWPCNTGATAVVRWNGEAGVVSRVAESKGRIGFATLPAALAKAGEVVMLRVGGISPEASGKRSTCAGASFTPPSGGSLNRDWSGVYPSAGAYAACMLTYGTR
jgi:hypothetical protein